MKSLLLSLLFSFSFYSCAQETVNGNGDRKTETRNVSPNFDGVNSSGAFEIEINDQAQDGKIKLEGDSNIINKILVEVKNNKLHIEFPKGFNFRYSKSIKVSLNARNLKSISLAGSGTIKANGTQNVDSFSAAISGSGDISAKVKATTTSAFISGSGDITLTGSTNEFKVSIAGSGDIHAFNLVATNANINVSGSGDTEVSVSGELKGAVAGSGDIFYRGNPSKVKLNASGSGDITQVK
jgi:hypothetical protein